MPFVGKFRSKTMIPGLHCDPGDTVRHCEKVCHHPYESTPLAEASDVNIMDQSQLVYLVAYGGLVHVHDVCGTIVGEGAWFYKGFLFAWRACKNSPRLILGASWVRTRDRAP